jgi:endonuclease G, mitochondrial
MLRDERYMPMNKSRLSIFTFCGALLAASLPAVAAPTQCPQFFVGGAAPDLMRADLVERAHVLCYSFYSVVESGVTRTGLWSAEHLTRDSVAAARALPRVDSFHAELGLPAADRGELEDYLGSSKDTGHLSPNGDMPDVRSQFESFALSNMIPQSPDNNRHLWEGIEIATRALARYDGELYVVTGPAFIGPRARVGGRVEVPSHVWKAVFDPRRGGAAAYVTLNRPGDAYAVVSIAELTRLTGVDPFPVLPPAVKGVAMSMPEPRPGGRKLGHGPVDEAVLGLTGPNAFSTLTGPAAQLVDDNGRPHKQYASAYSSGYAARYGDFATHAPYSVGGSVVGTAMNVVHNLIHHIAQ